MLNKPSLISLITFVSLAFCICLISTSLLAQNLPTHNSFPLAPTIPQVSSNLITNNPFVPINNEFKNQPQNPSGPVDSQ